MRPVATAGEHTVLIDGVIELGMIGQQHAGFRFGGFCGDMFLRVDVRLKIFNARVGRVVDEVKGCAAGVSDVYRLALVENAEDIVPGVCPGVSQMVTAVSPSVIFMPSVATMSRLGAMVL